MAIQQITIGTPGAGGGDPAHAAFKKVNDNFANPTHAASRQVGTEPGNLMEVGAFGIGLELPHATNNIDLATVALRSGFYTGNTWKNASFYEDKDSWGYLIQMNLASIGATGYSLQICSDAEGSISLRTKTGYIARPWAIIRTSKNTTIDGNGFLKNASPVVKLFSDRIELNHDAEKQPIIFEKLGVGNYVIKGSLGFAQESWYIEMPKDANGNVLVAVVYEQLENNDISVKTYAKRFDEETGDIVPNLTKPRDIPDGRWIDLRLHELPKPMPEVKDEPIE